jgi:hypothetical protein
MLPGEEEATETNLHALNNSAVETLKTVLVGADSDDVKRKAAVDILNFSQVGKSKGRAPVVTEAQLEFLGRVIVEASEVHKSLDERKRSVGGPAEVSPV